MLDMIHAQSEAPGTPKEHTYRKPFGKKGTFAFRSPKTPNCVDFERSQGLRSRAELSKGTKNV